MKNIGDMWLNNLRGSQLSPHQLAEAISENEKPAAEFLNDLKTKWLTKGIETAINEKSTEIIFEAPVSILGTQAFDKFLAWANSQHLSAKPSGLLFRDGADRQDCHIALRVTPHQAA